MRIESSLKLILCATLALTAAFQTSSSRTTTSFSSTRRRTTTSHHHMADPSSVLVDQTTPSSSASVTIEDDTSNDAGDPASVISPSSSASSRTAFEHVATQAALCLINSDDKTTAPKGGTANWIDNPSASQLQSLLSLLKLKLAKERTGIDRDEASAWIRWMKSTPHPMMVDVSQSLREIANATTFTSTTDDDLNSIEELLSRLGCHLILLPSGASLSSPLREPPATISYGTVLYGGVTRYRQVSTSSSGSSIPRRAGERTVIADDSDLEQAFVQYGGADRMYEALDMGAAAIFEVMLLPPGQSYSLTKADRDMVLRNMKWDPSQMFAFSSDSSSGKEDGQQGYTPSSQSGAARNQAFENDFTSSVGGLKPQIDAIVRRVLDGRVIRPATNTESDSEDETTAALSMAAMEAEELAVLGLTPVRGLLLYGPPGCGKTALAREISKALKARTPKIVSAPELLDRWVGGSEKMVRALFADAEVELAVCNGDPTKSALHVIVIDEIDAVFRKRSSADDSGESTRASVVNQILSKLDGIHSIPNVLLIGMTNRRELLDSALLRPGRLEVQIEIPLPDLQGRREILQIHFEALRKQGRLSKALCCAIDGIPYSSTANLDETVASPRGDDIPPAPEETDLQQRRTGIKRRKIKRAWSRATSSVRPVFDLASDRLTGGFSGADIAGLVRCSGSIALGRARRAGNGVEDLLVTLEDVREALREVKQ